MNEQKHYSWQDGLPTAPDVQSLLDRWPELQVGERIEYPEVQAVIGVAPDSTRWRSITNQWRKRLLEGGLVVKCETGAAFYVASASQITAETYKVITHIIRSAKTHRRHLSVARPESEAERSTIEHQGALMGAYEREGKKNRMNLLPSTKISEAPRIVPPATAKN